MIDGSPSIRQEIAFRGAGDDSNAGGCLSTGMRAVNAIPAVCAAPPGLLSPLDLPLIPGTTTCEFEHLTSQRAAAWGRAPKGR